MSSSASLWSHPSSWIIGNKPYYIMQYTTMIPFVFLAYRKETFTTLIHNTIYNDWSVSRYWIRHLSNRRWGQTIGREKYTHFMCLPKCTIITTCITIMMYTYHYHTLSPCTCTFSIAGNSLHILCTFLSISSSHLLHASVHALLGI